MVYSSLKSIFEPLFAMVAELRSIFAVAAEIDIEMSSTGANPSGKAAPPVSIARDNRPAVIRFPNVIIFYSSLNSLVFGLVFLLYVIFVLYKKKTTRFRVVKKNHLNWWCRIWKGKAVVYLWYCKILRMYLPIWDHFQ